MIVCISGIWIETQNPEAVYRRISAICVEIENLGFRKERIVDDDIGGTKSMTAGIILACAAPLRHLHLMKPCHYTADGRTAPKTEFDAVAIDSRFEIIASHGLRR